VQLFKRLENFYLRWCDGEFIDALQDNYPQKKMSQLQGQGIKTGLRQVDVYAGLNVMILLLELHRYAQSQDDLKNEIAFYPCGQPDTEGFGETSDRLLRIIGYGCCISVGFFLGTVGSFLRGANLSDANLSGADLSGADLSDADLSGAFLSGAFLSGAFLSRACLSGAILSRAFLRGAILSDADLSDADLSGATLFSAILSGADLSGAILSGAFLSRAILSGADLRGAILSGADLENIIWDEDTKWENVRGLETAQNVPEALKQQLGLR
jgi:hypothetical protein